MSGRRVEKGCGLESGILRQLGRRRRLSGHPKCVNHRRGDTCGEMRMAGVEARVRRAL